MRFPADGEYVFPEALAPLVVEAGIGTHIEPNVWIRHSVLGKIARTCPQGHPRCPYRNASG